MFKGICLKGVFLLLIVMTFTPATASHAQACIGFGSPQDYTIPVEGCDAVPTGDCQYTLPFVCEDDEPTYAWEIVRPSDPSLGKGGSIDQTGKLSVDGASCGTITVKVTGSCGLSAKKQVRLGTTDGENPTSQLIQSQHFGCSSEDCEQLGFFQCEVGDTSIGFFWTYAHGCPNCPHPGWPCPDFNVLPADRKTYSLGINRWGCKE
jgi:hypothetical protein